MGYLSNSNQHADPLFELISRCYEHKSTVITTYRAFKEWGAVFPNAACTASLIDLLVHRCEVVAIEGESCRLKETKARAELKAARHSATKDRQVMKRRRAVPSNIGFTQHRASAG